MAFLDDVDRTLSQLGQSALKKTKNMSETMRLSGAIREEEEKQKEEEKWAKANAENERAIGRTVLSLEYILTNHFNQVKMHFTKYAFDA